MISNTFHFPILSFLIFLPTLGALYILFFINKDRTDEIKRFAFAVSLIVFLISLLLIFFFDPDTPSFQWVEKHVWVEGFGISYFLGVDGISLLLVILTTLITSIAILASWEDIKVKVKGYMVMFLVLETGMLGVFMALDLFLFYIFWEVMLIPMVFIIGVWGGQRRVYSAIKFFIFTFFGSVFMLLGILAIYFYHGKITGNYTFDALVLFNTPVSPNLQFWVFLAFFLGFAVKVPMFPLHTWLPDAHTEAPTAGSVVLAGLLLKMGTYGFLRYGVTLLPDASMRFAPLMIFLAIFAIIYGALVTLAQRDMKKLIAYSSVSHMGFVMLGMFVFNLEGWEGSLLQMVNHGISTSGLFLLVGIIYERTHSRTIGDYTGLFKKTPVYGAFFLIIALSSMGMPVTNGFIGELLVLIGTFRSSWYLALMVVFGILLGAAYLLWLFQRVFLGNFRCSVKDLKDLNVREVATLIPLAVLVFWIGLYPKPFLRTMDNSLNHYLKNITARQETVSRERKKVVRIVKSNLIEDEDTKIGHGGYDRFK